MKPLLPILPLLALICSCKQNNSKTVANAADTSQVQKTTAYYHDRQLFKKDIAGYTVTIVERDALPNPVDESVNYDIEGNYIFTRDLQTNKFDSLMLQSGDDIGVPTVIDLSDSLKFKKPAFMITWTGDSDIEMNEFVTYENDTLKIIFALENIVSLKRKDASTITGFLRDRDEITYWFQDDYPVSISLTNHTIATPLPAVQYLGVSTVALADINVFRMTGTRDSVPYTIRRWTDLKVDTLFRARNTVKLIIGDSIILHAEPDSLHMKIQANNAG